MRGALLAAAVLGAGAGLMPVGPVSAAPKPPKPVVGYAQLDGSPVRWNPCEPHTYMVNPGAMPARDVATVNAAMREISKATGITWTFAGVSPVRVTDDVSEDSAFVKDATGSQLLISIQDPGENAMAFANTVAGAQLDYSPSKLWDWLDTGYLVMNRPMLAKVPVKQRLAFVTQQLLPLMNITASAKPGQYVASELPVRGALSAPVKKALASVGASLGCGRPPAAPTGFAAVPGTKTLSWTADSATDTRIDWIAGYIGEVTSPEGSLAVNSTIDELDVSSILSDSGPTTVQVSLQAQSYAGQLSPIGTATVVFPG